MGNHGKPKAKSTGAGQTQGTEPSVVGNMTGGIPPVSVTEGSADAAQRAEGIARRLSQALTLYNLGSYVEALAACEEVYEADAFRTDNLLLLGAVHFQMRNFSEAIFYCQQCVRVDPNFAEGYSNLGNALKELGDVNAAVQFYLKVSVSFFASPCCVVRHFWFTRLDVCNNRPD
jgi:Flp pilus assembly protein TadD